MEFTSSQQGNSPMQSGPLAQIPADQPVSAVTAEGGARAVRRCHAAIADRGGTAVIPIRRNGLA